MTGLRGYLLGRTPARAADTHSAASRYADLVWAEKDVPLWEGALRQQIFLGDDSFAARMLELAAPARTRSDQVPKAQRRSASHRPLTLSSLMSLGLSRNEALFRAATEGGQTLTALAREARLSISRVSRIVARKGRGEPTPPAGSAGG